MTLHVQLLTMIFMVLSGLYLGMALETFRRFSPLWRKNKFLVYFLEICFWLVQTLIIFYVLYRVNAGELRLYIFVACLLGFATYQALIASLYKRLLEQVVKLIAATTRLLKRIVRILILSPIGWIIRTLISTVTFMFFVLFQVITFILLPIKWLLQLAYYLLPKKIKEIFHKIVDFYSIIKNRLIKWVKSIKGR